MSVGPRSDSNPRAAVQRGLRRYRAGLVMTIGAALDVLAARD